MEKPTALVIEDERDIAALFRHVLDVAGYRTEIAMNGRDAVKRLDSMRPDIVLLDLNLPGVSGVKILEKMRADQNLMAVPVVVITAHSEVADSLPVEPDLVLLKPVNLDQLSNLIQRLRATSASMREAPWDPATHLYNKSFFMVRLAYSLERAKQVGSNYFGVMFADLDPFRFLKNRLDDVQLNGLLHEAASCLKTALRPTDTIARFDEGLFLILLEDMPGKDVPTGITSRVQLGLEKYLSEQKSAIGLRVYVGILLCNAAYVNVEEILQDIDLSRLLAREGGGNILYDREMLRPRR